MFLKNAVGFIILAIALAGCASIEGSLESGSGDLHSQNASDTFDPANLSAEDLWSELSLMGRQSLCAGQIDSDKIEFFVAISFAPEEPSLVDRTRFVSSLITAHNKYC